MLLKPQSGASSHTSLAGDLTAAKRSSTSRIGGGRETLFHAMKESGLALTALDPELAGIYGYYAGLIAAARNSLNPADAAAAVRSLQIQKILAVRAALDRQQAEQANRPRPVERFLANTNITVQHGGNRAFYSPDRDIVQMPELKSFRDAES